MKKFIYTLILPLFVVGGLVFANHKIKNESSKKSIPKPLGGVPPGGVPLTAAEMKAGRKLWKSTPDGIMFKKWEASPAGKKVYASEAKIRNSIRDFTNMEGIITSLSLPAGSRVGFGMMICINDEDFILSFGLQEKNEFEQLRSLKVNDKIIIKSRSVMHAPKYTYPIVSGDYVERNSTILYKRPPRKGGC
jgi:CRISPR/Cas system CSM-associated protein Csm3 (group 7 of RAMP superfamily)